MKTFYIHIINENNAHTVHAHRYDFSLDHKVITFVDKDNCIVSEYIARNVVCIERDE